ncbi:M6 family metalloprotease domain-containing protein [Williamwhitmania taraxaci]|nr:M6 family metalloprotease domain-containing protein [Williamwhitmania taraxaci]
MRISFILALLFTVAFPTRQADASPAYPKPVQFTQPDGSTITLTLKGDEHAKWAMTTDGYTLMSNAKGYYEYATTDNRGMLKPSGVVAKNSENRSTEDAELLSGISKGLRYSKEQTQMLKSIRSIQNSEATRAFPTTGKRKLICILMGFKDKAFTKTQADFNNLFNQVNYSANGATGSVKDYYLENSYNKFNLTVTVAGPYTASHDMAFYGANDSDDGDVKADTLVVEAVSLANPSINYADYDNDNNDTVDGVYVIYAGYGEEVGAPADAIWAHAWQIPTTKPATTYDGKTIKDYSCSAELSGNSGSTMTSIGVICHEFGHVLGAPDYYDTDYEKSDGDFYGTGNWDLMAGGSWNNHGITPAHHNAFTKVNIYKWATATELSSSASIEIPASITNDKAFYRIPTTTTNEYYLLENRQQLGFDAKTPGHGLLIYHVDKDVTKHYNNNDINIKAPQLMYPVCASATTNPGTTVSSYGNISSGGCTFPGTSNKNTFSDQTIPSAKSSNGALSGIALTNITENTLTNVVTFNFTKSTTDVKVITASSINCYPSPFSNNLNISSQGPLKSITIYDLTGKIIVYQTATGENIQTVNTSALSNGYYLVKVVDANGIATTIKTVKQ